MLQLPLRFQIRSGLHNSMQLASGKQSLKSLRMKDWSHETCCRLGHKILTGDSMDIFLHVIELTAALGIKAIEEIYLGSLRSCSRCVVTGHYFPK